MQEKHCLKITYPTSQPHAPIMNEFIRFIDIKKLTRLPAAMTFAANPAEKEALARRLGLVVLNTLEIECTIQGALGHYPLLVSAIIKADVMQSCVLTLKDLPSTVEEQVKLALFLSDTDSAFLTESFEEDQPEPVVLNKDGTVEIGEILVQYLSLALDPYPKFEADPLS
jgi:hypothetical protein